MTDNKQIFLKGRNEHDKPERNFFRYRRYFARF